MNWNNKSVLLSFLICFLSSYTNGHLVLNNGNHVKELTPAEPQEVEAFIHTLRRYAEETFGSRKIREGNIAPLSSIVANNSSINATTAFHENGTNLISDRNARNETDPHNTIWTKTLKNERKHDWPKTSVESIVHDTLHSLLKSFGDNASRPEIFKTNFGLKHTDEDNY
uniref:Uncharacterized protein n=1 Tax=Lygus hesperus TaxID=30085 RepID=A0A0K8SZD2_LYGHE